MFEQLIRESNERMAQEETVSSSNQMNDPQTENSQTSAITAQTTKPSLTEEQKQRMLKNRQLAEERRRQKQEEMSESLKNSESLIIETKVVTSSQ